MINRTYFVSYYVYVESVAVRKEWKIFTDNRFFIDSAEALRSFIRLNKKISGEEIAIESFNRV